MARSKKRFLTRIVIVASVFLLAANALLGLALTEQSAAAMRTQIQKRMLDVCKSAAALLDGDALAVLRPEDAGTPAFEADLAVLRVFQEQAELAYIYSVRDMGDGTFTFVLDPSADPGVFGEEVHVTDALRAASAGTPAVDETSYEDRWGRFYSAYCPVFDARGSVAGVVVVDFDAVWYERQISRQICTTLVCSALSLLLGGSVVYIATVRFRRRMAELDREINSLTGDMEELAGELRRAAQPGEGTAEPPATDAPQAGEAAQPPRSEPGRPDSGDAIEALSGVVRSVREEMRRYIADAHALAYTDAMTGVGNRAAYLNTVERLEHRIAEGTAAFSVAVFDVNSLKRVNDAFGHEYGDRLIVDAAVSLKAIFGAKNVYRIGGDEFIAVLEDASPEDAGGLFAALDEKIAAMPLAVSKGTAEFRKAEDRRFADVFRRADEAMYHDKAAYYAERGDRRQGAPR